MIKLKVAFSEIRKKILIIGCSSSLTYWFSNVFGKETTSLDKGGTYLKEIIKKKYPFTTKRKE